MYKIWRRLGLGLLKTFDIVEKTWLAKNAMLIAHTQWHSNTSYYVI